MNEPIKVFVCYAHEDDSFKKELDIQLKLLGMQMPIKVWSDENILPTQLWDKEIKDALSNADVVLLLVSNDFLVSNYINNVEIKGALERYNKGETAVLPIILRPTDFGSFEISKFQALPRRAKPISTWDDKDQAWLNVSQGLKKVFNAVVNKKKANNTNTIQSTITPPVHRTTQNSTHPTIDPVDISVLYKAQQLLADNETGKAIKLLFEYTKLNSLDDKHNSLSLLSSQFNSLKKDSELGLRRLRETDVDMNRITKALLSIISDLKEEAGK